MGSFASKQKVLEAEFNKPGDISDIDTPRGVSAKNEVKRLRALLAEHREIEQLLSKAILGDVPSLEAYLKKMFKEHDLDGSGNLSWEEFKKLLTELDLGLTEDEIEKLRQVTDTDVDGEISPEEFARSAPDFLKKVYAEQDTSEHVWSCLTDEQGNHYYYNKQTGESSWECPQEYKDSIGGLAKETEEKIAPKWKDYLVRIFTEADVNESKKLSKEEFRELVDNKLQLGLSEDQFEQLMKKLDVDSDEQVAWEEFVVHAPEFVMGLMSDTDEASCWVEATDEAGNLYYYNSKTGETSWELPTQSAEGGDQALPPAEDGDQTQPPTEDVDEAQPPAQDGDEVQPTKEDNSAEEGSPAEENKEGSPAEGDATVVPDE